MQPVSITQVDPKNSVILLGSGFSLGSKNLKGESPPNGTGLKKHFLNQLNMPSDSTYDLQVLSEEFSASSNVTFL